MGGGRDCILGAQREGVITGHRDETVGWSVDVRFTSRDSTLGRSIRGLECNACLAGVQALGHVSSGEGWGAAQ